MCDILHVVNVNNNIKNSSASIPTLTPVCPFLTYYSHEGSQPRMKSKLLQSVRRVSENFLCDVIGNAWSCNTDSSIGNVLHLAYVLTTSAVWRNCQTIFRSLTNWTLHVSYIYVSFNNTVGVPDDTASDCSRNNDQWLGRDVAGSGRACYVQLSRNVPKT